MHTIASKAACILPLYLLSVACTPTVTLRSGADLQEATMLAASFCAAARTEDSSDERELFSAELRQLFEEVAAAQRQQYLTSAGSGTTCVPGAVTALGPPPNIISMDVRITVGAVTDRVHLRRDGGVWRIDDVNYGRPRRVGTISSDGFKIALRSLTQLQPAPAPAGNRFLGRFRFGFELSTFNGCWLSLGQHWDQFEAPPPGSGGIYEYDVEFVGSRRGGAAEAPTGQDFGHMGRYSCEYQIQELISVRRPSPAPAE